MHNRNGIVGGFFCGVQRRVQNARYKNMATTHSSAGDVHCKKNFDKLPLRPRHEHNFFLAVQAKSVRDERGGGSSP
jgi:hypothetical protein